MSPSKEHASHPALEQPPHEREVENVADPIPEKNKEKQPKPVPLLHLKSERLQEIYLAAKSHASNANNLCLAESF